MLVNINCEINFQPPESYKNDPKLNMSVSYPSLQKTTNCYHLGASPGTNNSSTIVQQHPVISSIETISGAMDHNHPCQIDTTYISKRNPTLEELTPEDNARMDQLNNSHSHLRTPACSPTTNLSSEFCKCKILLNFEDVG